MTKALTQNLDLLSEGDAGTAPRLRQCVRIPMLDGQADAEVYTFHNLSDGREHLAIGLGPWAQHQEPLIRVHSECLTGDVFGSCKCDCGPQLKEAMARLQSEGGLLLYLRQEGRDIGLYNKLDAYALQSIGLDTYEANRRLNFPDDLRDYTCAAEMLGALGIHRVRLLTNNPLKAKQLRAHGVVVTERVRTGVFINDHNRRYLSAKVQKTYHTIDLNAKQEPNNHD